MTNIVKANGINIAYEEHGAGEPLILIMGLGAPALKWMPHIEAYKEHFRVIAIDNRGAGRSDRPAMEAYTTQDMADDAVGVMDALGIESAHLHGISMGGAICQLVAIQHPERVRSLILTSTYAKMDVTFRRAVEMLRDACGQVDGDTLNHICQWIIYSHKFMNEHEQFILDAEKYDAEHDLYPMPVYAYKAQCNACLTHDTLSQLHQIQCPTLVASGEQDYFASVDITMEMVHNIPNAVLYLCHNGGHVHHWEQLKDFNAFTLDFLLAQRTGEA